MRKITTLLLSIALILSMCFSVSAAEFTEPIAPMAASRPTTSHSTPYQATITNLEPGHLTYTRYYFSPTSEDLEVYGTFYHSVDSEENVRYKIKINLYKVGTSANEDSYTVTIEASKTSVGFTHTFTGLSTESNYYFSFENLTTESEATSRCINGDVFIR